MTVGVEGEGWAETGTAILSGIRTGRAQVAGWGSRWKQGPCNCLQQSFVTTCVINDVGYSVVSTRMGPPYPCQDIILSYRSKASYNINLLCFANLPD